MKLKRILAVALSVATVAGAGVMAAISADAASVNKWDCVCTWGVWSLEKGNNYNSGKSPRKYDIAHIYKETNARLDYVQKLGGSLQTHWVVEATSWGGTNKGAEARIYGFDSQSGNFWDPTSNSLMLYLKTVDDWGYSKQTEWDYDRQEAFVTNGVMNKCLGRDKALKQGWNTDWWRNLKRANFTAKYVDNNYNFELRGEIKGTAK